MQFVGDHEHRLREIERAVLRGGDGAEHLGLVDRVVGEAMILLTKEQRHATLGRLGERDLGERARGGEGPAVRAPLPCEGGDVDAVGERLGERLEVLDPVDDVAGPVRDALDPPGVVRDRLDQAQVGEPHVLHDPHGPGDVHGILRAVADDDDVPERRHARKLVQPLDFALMDFLADLFHQLSDLNTLVATAGYAGITTIIFIETGLLFPFLPGDSLLVTAGLVAAQQDGLVTLNVWTLGVLCSLAAANHALPNPHNDAHAFAHALFDQLVGHRRFGRVREAYSPAAHWSGPGGRRLFGWGEITGWFTALIGSFGDARFHIQHVAAVDDMIAVRWEFAATHDGGALYGAATGEPIYILAVTHWRIENGVIADEVTVFDEVALMRQMEGGL